MKVLVTGGTGFSGKALVTRLLTEGHQVTALDYKEGLKTEELRQLGAEVIIGSVTDKEIVSRSVAGVEVVFHLAAAFRELNVPESFYDEVNIEGTRNVVEAAQAAGVRRLIYCSTCGVHGNVDHPPANEDAPIQPADYYQKTKYEAEPIVMAYNGKGMATVILRPAAIYGPGDPERFYLIYRRVASGSFPMFGSGRTLYHPLYIDNLVDAFMLCMEDGKGDGRAYLIADEHYVSVEELVRAVAKALSVEVRIPHFPVWPVVVAGHVCERVCKPFGVTPPIFPRRVDWYRQNRAFDISRARVELGYQPRIGLEEGLRRTAEWYRAEGYLPPAAGGKPTARAA
ncbi:nucleoside-diphosphate-sugar epimerase [Natronocella acetinitrilica]|uniref:Nucleoside-diphosphate-sugar epimerase n=1 Tax=Natronocella acetinitrilica TaxID=414046 RepID=A0AAE3G640_9GAMM|nr:NAD-dependent epimerase/dehydratase family protein [Natronocella acetinitrilica]MCP1675788.1 nucleoside-diphosphate-sugar epimerase [Natronocella acetinitrilica]